ncbi:tyrosine-type recombinase/integrase [Planctomicrobium sp. SH664]|uniref:tyrosine-type recombinase/integrase n=1 Tax=Planctomicrobium sp. SH664 TaxID=3448125 RepID=UPI003F5B1F6D
MPKFAKPWFRASRGVWYVTLDGKQVNLGPDQAVAFDEYARLISQPKEVRQAPAHSLPAVIDAFLGWLKPRRASDTFEWYRYRLERLARRYPTIGASQLTTAMVEDWVDEYSLSVTSRRNYFRAAKKCLKWARSRGLVKRNRIRDLEVPSGESREIVITADEYQDLLDNIRNPGVRDLVITTWETGCRPQESLRVEARHVDLPNQRWVFPKSESKNRKLSRVVYLTDAAAAITSRLAVAHPTGKLFRNSNGKPWKPDAVNDALLLARIRIGKRIMKQQGITISDEEIETFAKTLAPTCRVKQKKITKSARMLFVEARMKLTKKLAASLAPRYSLYALRHTWATNALQKGVDPLTTAILMGHSDPSTLSRVYQHVALNPVHMLSQARKAAE